MICGLLTGSNCRGRCRSCTRLWSNQWTGQCLAHAGLVFCDGTVLALIQHEGINMLWTILVILVVLWALGMATSYTAGGLIHILLVIAVVVLAFRLISGRRVV